MSLIQMRFQYKCNFKDNKFTSVSSQNDGREGNRETIKKKQKANIKRLDCDFE